MELPVDSARLTSSPNPITVWDSKRLSAFRSNPMAMYLNQVIDAMGLGSKAAQGLSSVLTSVQRLHDNPGHRLYLLCQDRMCLGIMKIGTKKLFIRTRSGKLHEIEPLCVLDFYVHEAAQRSGFGKLIYDFMISHEQTTPERLGYDRPSPKFLAFLKKHFGLSDFVPQSNNFVVFSRYFGERGEPEEGQPLQRRHTLSANRIAHGTSDALLRPAQVNNCAPLPRCPTDIPTTIDRATMLNHIKAGPAGDRSAVMRTAPSSLMSSHVAAQSSQLMAPFGRRAHSPTRSSAAYNIISLEDSGVAEQFAVAARPQGRRGDRK